MRATQGYVPETTGYVPETTDITEMQKGIHDTHQVGKTKLATHKS